MRVRHWRPVITIAYIWVSLFSLADRSLQAASIPVAPTTQNHGELTELADARNYRHCHNMPRRMDCHAAERLPRN